MSGSEGKIRFLPRHYGAFRSWVRKYFAEEVLPNAGKVFDPMAGNAPFIPYIEKNGLKGYFNDILPFHYYVNRAKAVDIRTEFERRKAGFYLRELSILLRGLRNKKLVISDDWIHEDILHVLTGAWVKTERYEPGVRALLRAVILLTVRPYSSVTGSVSNSTWFKKGGMSTGENLNDVVNSKVGVFREYYEKNYEGIPERKTTNCRFYKVDAADSKLNIKTKFGVILTSPPYCNRYEPRGTFGPELFFLKSVGEKVNDTDIIGTTVVGDYTQEILEEDEKYIRGCSPKAARFIKEIRLSKLRDSMYYAKYYYRYYSKLFRTLENAQHYLEAKGRFYIVGQDNIHRGDLNEMGKFITEYFDRKKNATKKRFTTTIVKKEAVSHQGRRNISADRPLVVKKHWEYIIEAVKRA